MKRLLLSIFVLSMAACAGDLSGTWKAKAEGVNGSMERTFVFKVDGTKLTGETISSMLGKSSIADGKVDGDDFSFSITASFQGTEMKLSYKGKITGDEIKITSHVAGDDSQAVVWTGKKVQ